MQEAFELGQRASVDRVEPGTKVQEEAPRLLIVIPDSKRTRDHGHDCDPGRGKERRARDGRVAALAASTSDGLVPAARKVDSDDRNAAACRPVHLQ